MLLRNTCVIVGLHTRSRNRKQKAHGTPKQSAMPSHQRFISYVNGPIT